MHPYLRLLALALLAAASPAAAGFDDCIASMRGGALARGVSAATYDRETQGLQSNPEVLGFLDKQPEFRTPIWDYLAGLVDDERIADGRAKMREYQNALSVAQARFGVDAATIAAVWGVESDYGKTQGFRSVVRSLATLSCAGRRQDYFRTEFYSALTILERGDVDPQHFTGSWAGAFGQTQFMPSTFLRYAVDLEGHGRRDVVDSVPDALGSTANFLRKGGWVTGQPWGFEVRLPDGYSGPSGRGARQSMASWAARGVTRVDGGELGAGMAGLLLPAGRNGPAFLVTHNFEVIFGYNAAESYALAIALLSDRLRGGGPIATAWPTRDRGLSRVERREMQGLLAQRGYAIGNQDGVLGAKTRAAIADFQGRAGLAADGAATGAVLEALRRP